jgi:hypothetical protein
MHASATQGACLPACLPALGLWQQHRHVIGTYRRLGNTYVQVHVLAPAAAVTTRTIGVGAKAHGGPLSTTYLTTACGAIHAYAGERCNVNPGALRGEGVRRRRRRAAERPPAERIQPLNLDVGGDCGGIMAAAGVGGGGGSGSCSAAVGLAPA